MIDAEILQLTVDLTSKYLHDIALHTDQIPKYIDFHLLIRVLDNATNDMLYYRLLQHALMIERSERL